MISTKQKLEADSNERISWLCALQVFNLVPTPESWCDKKCSTFIQLLYSCSTHVVQCLYAIPCFLVRRFKRLLQTRRCKQWGDIFGKTSCGRQQVRFLVLYCWLNESFRIFLSCNRRSWYKRGRSELYGCDMPSGAMTCTRAKCIISSHEPSSALGSVTRTRISARPLQQMSWCKPHILVSDSNGTNLDRYSTVYW